ncbi:MAG: amidohydrolase family protein [Acidimicrobiia bacterium]|nr:amidohydrolase family protein [Acidimicrobiia bacterium]
MTRFIDAHVHPPIRSFLEGPIAPFLDDLRSFLEEPIVPQSPDQIAEFYRSRDAKAVLLGWNTHAKSGQRSLGNTDIAALVEHAPDVFYGFGAVDPSGGAGAVAGIHQAARLGLSGLAFHPASERMAPSDRESRQLWETATEHGLVCLIHTGFTRLGAGVPGGGGVGLEPARPIHVDRVAAAFPGLKLILAHTGPLWLDEAIAVSVHKSNVHLCLSGISPKAMSPELLELIRGALQNRVHFGSDYPFGSPDSWLAEWDSLGLSDEVSRAVLVDNVAQLLAR